MPTSPLVPIDITTPTKEFVGIDGGSSVSPTDHISADAKESPETPSQSPLNVHRRVSDRLKTQMRASRSASLIIPVVTTNSTENLDDIGDADIVDINATLADGTSLSDNDESILKSPILPSRPPKTPPRIRTNLIDSQFDPVDQYGMERIHAAQFSPATLKDTSLFDTEEIKNHNKKDTYEEGYRKFLAQSRKFQVDFVLELLTSANMTVGDSVFFEKIHSSDVFVATLSQMRVGDYSTPNKPILYALILKSLKVGETIFRNQSVLEDETQFHKIISDLSFMIKSPEDKKTEYTNDFLSIYSLFASINDVKQRDGETDTSIIPNPLIAAFLYRCASKFILPQALIMALLLNEYVTSNGSESREFRFLFLRSIEAIDPQLLLNQVDAFSNPLTYVNSLIASTDFWVKLVEILYDNDKQAKNHPLGLTNVLFNFVVNGAYSLIEVLINLRHELQLFGLKEKPADFKLITPDLVRFHREFTILNESGESQITNLALDKLYSKNQELQHILQEKTRAYNELLNNYKQLNEEKMSVEDTISKHNEENQKLQAVYQSISGQVDQLLSQYDVIQQTVQKNERVQKMNETMMLEIERLKHENLKLQAK